MPNTLVYHVTSKCYVCLLRNNMCHLILTSNLQTTQWWKWRSPHTLNSQARWQDMHFLLPCRVLAISQSAVMFSNFIFMGILPIDLLQEMSVKPVFCSWAWRWFALFPICVNSVLMRGDGMSSRKSVLSFIRCSRGWTSYDMSYMWKFNHKWYKDGGKSFVVSDWFVLHLHSHSMKDRHVAGFIQSYWISLCLILAMI